MINIAFLDAIIRIDECISEHIINRKHCKNAWAVAALKVGDASRNRFDPVEEMTEALTLKALEQDGAISDLEWILP